VRPFGATETSDPVSVALPSEVRLPTPTSAMRLLVAARPAAEHDGVLSAEWAAADRKTVKVRHPGAYPLNECWAVSKEAVWRLSPIAANSSPTLELTNPIKFSDWAKQLTVDPNSGVWNPRDQAWVRKGADRFGLVVSFYEMLHASWFGERTRYRLYERGIDRSPELESGAVILVGSFDRNLSEIRCAPVIPERTLGWVRATIREGTR
jgi:hypothetical protein